MIDSLASYGVRHLDMPLAPGRVWRALQGAGTAGHVDRLPASGRVRGYWDDRFLEGWIGEEVGP